MNCRHVRDEYYRYVCEVLFGLQVLSESDDSYRSNYQLRNNIYLKLINMLPDHAGLTSF